MAASTLFQEGTIDEFLDSFNGSSVGFRGWSLKVDQGIVRVAVHYGALNAIEVVLDGLIRPGHHFLDRFKHLRDGINRGNTTMLVLDPVRGVVPGAWGSWYLGHAGFPAQAPLNLLFSSIQRVTSARMVFRGGSAGGFAALYFSWHLPGSVAVAVNPQINLENHWRPERVAEFRRLCWPNLPDSVSLTTVATPNVIPLYESSVPNWAFILNNSSDTAHLTRHLGPFLSTVANQGDGRIVLVTDNWGAAGHAMPPPEVLRKVTDAAMNAPLRHHDAIFRWAKNRGALPFAGLHAEAIPAETRHDPDAVSKRDINLATIIAGSATSNREDQVSSVPRPSLPAGDPRMTSSAAAPIGNAQPTT